MRWNYDDAWRDKFETCEHRDILIVPHPVKVDKVAGGPPEVRSRIPIVDSTTGVPIEPIQYRDLDFVITNENIYKEKFEYTNSLNTSDNLTFSSCESAMVKFTIRNTKIYNETTGKYELEIPNLQTLSFYDEDNNLIVGEVQTHYVIEVYMYFNGDSSSLIYLGMFVVEEDKVSDDGYSRDITAYDFMATLRDMDIGYWYYHLFKGINYLDDDFKDYLKELEDEGKVQVDKTEGHEDYDCNWMRKPKRCWTVGEALKDIFQNIVAFHPEERTISNDKEYYTTEDNVYTGFGMPILLDDDLFDYTKKYNIPTETGENNFECYGYLEILELPFYPDPSVMESKTLSFGKFLEDIGTLAGRYPFIRTDYIHEEDYVTPVEGQPETYYSTYEKCILSFKPLPKEDAKIVANNYFDNSDLAKGFKHDLYKVSTILMLEVYNKYDSSKPIMKYANLTKSQKAVRSANSDSVLKTFKVANNIFTDYLAKKQDDVAEDYKDDFQYYEEIIKLLDKGDKDYQYPEDSVHGDKPYIESDTSGDDHALMHPCYANIKYRTYRPYELTTFADPVRDVGDRIHITFEDRVTGEKDEFDTYILERKISGIQKMMDTYTAKGDMDANGFSDYKTNTKYSASSYSMQSFGYNRSSSITTSGGTNLTGLTANDFVEIIRNIGFRLLDEPSSVTAIFSASTTNVTSTVRIINSSSWSEFPKQGESDIHTGDTTNPIAVWNQSEEIEMFNVSAGDYFIFSREGDGVEYPVQWDNPCYLYDGSKWVYVGNNTSGGCNFIYASSFDGKVTIDEISEITEGSTINELTLRPKDGETYFLKERLDNTNFYQYGYDNDSGAGGEKIHGSIKFTPKYGDAFEISGTPSGYAWQYPGFWTSGYPKEGEITTTTKPRVSLKWTDPENIAEWEPKPCSWEGTIVVRKLNAPPLNRWDGVEIVDSTVRDQFKNTAYVDDTIELNRVYYYGLFPYYTAIQDAQHPIKYYRFTKVVRVSTGKTLDAPEILSIERIS